MIRRLTSVTGYCGNSLNAGSVGAPTTECSMVCGGNSFDYCGAGNRLQLYSLTAGSSTTAASTEGETIEFTSSPPQPTYRC